MKQCLIYALLQNGTVRSFPLPEMTLPQSLLPEKAVFKGVGTVQGRDCYLFVVRSSVRGETVQDKALIQALSSIARKEKPQTFTLQKGQQGWTLQCEELRETQYYRSPF